MILSKTAKTICNSKNKKILEARGYQWVNGKEIEIKLEDLAKSSRSLVQVRCRYCKKIKERKYSDVLKVISNSPFSEYSCKDCRRERLREMAAWRHANGELKPGQQGYWSIKENRMKELSSYIMENNTANNLWINTCIPKMFTDYGHDLDEALIELGYDPNEIKGKVSNGYYDNFEVISEKIENFMAIYKRFPSYGEFKTELNITMKHILKHGGIRELKKRFNITHDEYVDLRGFYNSSSFEYIVANFLISNKISYKREQKPFPGENYRSDFTFYLKDGEVIHCELWGYSVGTTGRIGDYYNSKRKEKERLYIVNNLKFISLELEMFKGNSYEQIQTYLIDAFSTILNVDLKMVEQAIVIPPNKLTDEEIFNEIMKKSNNPDYLPKIKDIRYSLGEEIRKRYGTYEKFGEVMGKKNLVKNWSKDRFVSVFMYMLKKYNRILGTRELASTDDYQLIGFYQSVEHRGNWIDEKIKFYRYCLEHSIRIPDKELSIMISYSEGKGAYKGIVPKQRKEIQEIVLKLGDQIKERNISEMLHRKWSDEVCFEMLKDVLSKYGEIPGIKRAKKLGLDKEYITMYNAVHTREGFIKLKLRFYLYCLKNELPLTENEIISIRKISLGSSPFTSVSEKDKALATDILNKIK